jgi:hypothetical protein
MSSLSHVHVEVAIKDEFAAARRQIEALAQHASGPNLVASPRCWRPQPVKIRTPTCENPIARQAGGGPIFTAWGLTTGGGEKCFAVCPG